MYFVPNQSTYRSTNNNHNNNTYYKQTRKSIIHTWIFVCGTAPTSLSLANQTQFTHITTFLSRKQNGYQICNGPGYPLNVFSRFLFLVYVRVSLPSLELSHPVTTSFYPTISQTPQHTRTHIHACNLSHSLFLSVFHSVILRL